MILVDTGAWAARVLPDDAHHQAATAWFRSNAEPLIATDYIVDEVLTLLQARGHGDIARVMGTHFFNQRQVSMHFLTESDVLAAWQVFHEFRDKQWSFTDCTSKVVMESLGITRACSFDRHFRQFGGIDVVPSD